MCIRDRDIIERSAKIVDELVVGVLNNSAKNSLFSLEERVSMITVSYTHLDVYKRQSIICLLNLPDIGYIRVNRERIVCVIHDKAGCGTVWLFDIFLLQKMCIRDRYRACILCRQPLKKGEI